VTILKERVRSKLYSCLTYFLGHNEILDGFATFFGAERALVVVKVDLLHICLEEIISLVLLNKRII